MKNLSRSSVAMGIAVATISMTSLAVADEEKSPHSVSGNLTFTTNYVVRGITQTSAKPALQGTLDYAHSSGFYAGFFGSNASWMADVWEVDPSLPAGGSAYGGSPNNAISGSLEIDLYAGYRGAFAGDFTYDVGGVYYYYPGKYLLDRGYSPGLKNANTGEIYAGLGWKWITAKVWYAVTDGVFMVPEASGTTYFNLSATVPVGETGINVIGSVGTWMWSGTAPYLTSYGLKNDIYDLIDYKLGVTKDFMGFTFGAYYWGSTADKSTRGVSGANAGVETAVWGNRFQKNLGDDTFFLTVTKAF